MRRIKHPVLIFLLSLFSFPAVTVGERDSSRSGTPEVVWMWSGAVTSNSAVIKAKLRSGIREADLYLKPFQDSKAANGTVVKQKSKADSNGILEFQLAGLRPDSAYQYGIGTEKTPRLGGQFRTFADEPMSFRICFASCATTGSNHKIFDTLNGLRPHLFIHMGDLHYEDIVRNDPALFRRAYDRVLTAPRQGGFYRSAPIAYVWDDHDFGPDDADGASPSKAAALQAYQQCVPHYALFPVDGRVRTIQQAFTIGRVRFILLDVRAERTPEREPDGPDKTMLGKHQLEWLRGELMEAGRKHPLVVLVNPVPWITKSKPGGRDGWEPYSHERTLIADMVQRFGLADRLIMLSGDGHMVAMDDGTNSNYASGRKPGERSFPVVQAAPLDRYPRIKGGPYSHGAFAPKRWLRILKARQFGLMDLEDDGKRIRVTLTCRDSNGRTIRGFKMQLECDSEGCNVTN